MRFLQSTTRKREASGGRLAERPGQANLPPFGKKGIAISVDALLAMTLFIAVVTFLAVEPVTEIPQSRLAAEANQLIDDAVSAMDSTGFIMEMVENIPGKTKAELEQEIYDKIRGLLPEQMDFRLEMQQFQSSLDEPGSQCRSTGSFEECFPDSPTAYIETGGSVPNDRDVFHGQKMFIKKEPGNCILAELEGKQKETPIMEFGEEKPAFTVMRLAGEICDNSIDDDSDSLVDCDDPACATFPDCINMDFTFTSSITVGGEDTNELECDQLANVELEIGREASTRMPVDVIFAASKNTSMAECIIAGGRPGSPLLDNGESVERADFEHVAGFDFAVTAQDTNAFDVVLSWEEECSPNCPELRLKSPGGTFYGLGQASTLQNSTACNETDPAVLDKEGQSQRAYYYNNRTHYRYLALGSALVESGTWEVWVKNTVPTGYEIYAKYIDNNHWVETNPAEIRPWDEPISKVDIAKVLITEFANRAEWQVTDSDSDLRDKYAYAEIGLEYGSANEKSAIQPNNGLKDAKDLGPPISSQLKNLDAAIDFIAEPSYVHALITDVNRMINWRLYDQHPEWLSHKKFAVIYADRSDNPDDEYSIDQAIESVDRDEDGYSEIYYYTIDLSNEVMPGNENCQNNDLYRLGWETGGRCYAASDEGMLNLILDIIAVQIGNRAGIDPDENATLVMDFNADFQYSFFDGSITHPHTWNDGTKTLTFQNVTVVNGIWKTDFDLLVPCDFSDCDNFFQEGKTISLPPAETTFYYDINSVTQEPITWPAEQIVKIFLKFRDIIIEFIQGHYYGLNEVTIEYKVSNTGYLDAELSSTDPTVNFYTAPLPTQACDPAFRSFIDFDNLTQSLEPGLPSPGPNSSVVDKKELDESGHLCLFLNEEQDISDCGENNSIVVQCDIPKTFVYVLDYWAWEK